MANYSAAFFLHQVEVTMRNKCQYIYKNYNKKTEFSYCIEFMGGICYTSCRYGNP